MKMNICAREGNVCVCTRLEFFKEVIFVIFYAIGGLVSVLFDHVLYEFL
jgi:hypothetical protein